MDREESIFISEKRVCRACIEEEYLKNLIAKDGVIAECHYCGENGPCYSIGELSELVDGVFRKFYARTNDAEPEEEYGRRNEPGYYFERDGQDIIGAIAEVAEVTEEVASDIQKVLECNNEDWESAKMGTETEYSSESYYEEFGISDSDLVKQWEEMENSLKVENRFFNPHIYELFSLLFNDLSKLQTHLGKQLLVKAGPDTGFDTVYRARSFQSTKGLYNALEHPDEQLGPPPSELAKDGRMNPFGVSVFYGAKSPEVALAEVRPPVSSQVAIAEFTIIRTILLLDLSVLDAVSLIGSYFDPEFVRMKERVLFLEELGKRIAEPVLPDHEKFEYLTTQFIADYLASNSTQEVEGILFPSVQASTEGEINIVLFHESARVEAIQLPPGTKIRADNYGSIFNSDTPGYNVAIEVPRDGQESVEEVNPNRADYLSRDDREPVLRVNPGTIKVHTINRIDYDTTELSVSRNQFEALEEQATVIGLSLDEMINPQNQP